jgi:hypothetical protein
VSQHLPDAGAGRKGKKGQDEDRDTVHGSYRECLIPSSFFFLGENIYKRKGRGVREKSSKNKLSNKPSCALITLEAITA